MMYSGAISERYAVPTGTCGCSFWDETWLGGD